MCVGAAGSDERSPLILSAQTIAARPGTDRTSSTATERIRKGACIVIFFGCSELDRSIFGAVADARLHNLHWENLPSAFQKLFFSYTHCHRHWHSHRYGPAGLNGESEPDLKREPIRQRPCAQDKELRITLSPPSIRG